MQSFRLWTAIAALAAGLALTSGQAMAQIANPPIYVAPPDTTPYIISMNRTYFLYWTGSPTSNSDTSIFAWFYDGKKYANVTQPVTCNITVEYIWSDGHETNYVTGFTTPSGSTVPSPYVSIAGPQLAANEAVISSQNAIAKQCLKDCLGTSVSSGVNLIADCPENDGIGTLPSVK